MYRDEHGLWNGVRWSGERASLLPLGETDKKKALTKLKRTGDPRASSSTIATLIEFGAHPTSTRDSPGSVLIQNQQRASALKIYQGYAVLGPNRVPAIGRSYFSCLA
jgi:hypothetical protein